MSGLRDVSIIAGCGVFVAALIASIANLVGLSSGDTTNSVVFGHVAGVGLGFALAALHPGQRQ